MNDQILTKSSTPSIQSALNDARPSLIAVAYLGRKGFEYVATDGIEAIVISPELGTHPDAVRELARKIGWNKIHLLDGLHAKVYVAHGGANRVAIIGSANLSRNGVDSSERYEMCVQTFNPASVDLAAEQIKEWCKRAHAAYPDQGRKEARLRDLEKTISKNPAYREGSDFLSVFARGGEIDVYVTYEAGKNTDETIRIVKNLKGEIESGADDWINFRRNDKIELGKWILLWRMDTETKRALDKPFHASWPTPRWIHIDTVYSRSTEDQDYPDLAVMWRLPDNSWEERIKSAPFEITEDFKNAFWSVLNDNIEGPLAPLREDRGRPISQTSKSAKEARRLLFEMIYAEMKKRKGDSR